MNSDYKYTLPIGENSFFVKKHITRRDDSPVTEEESSSFMKKYSGQLFKAQTDISRFE